MRQRGVLASAGLVLVLAAAWLGRAGQQGEKPGWIQVAPGVLRSPGAVAGYALVADGEALLIDAPVPADGLAAHAARKVAGVLLTHYHRDVVAAVPSYLGTAAVRAPKKADE